MKTATIKLFFGKEVEARADVQSGGVPLTLILESLQNLLKGISQEIIRDAEEEIPLDKLEEYLNARIKLDRDLMNL